jgi:hypothetical protein
MTAIIEFLTACLLYWKHGFFYHVGKTILLGPDIWQSALEDLHLAYDEYDQALLLQVASTMIGMFSFAEWLRRSTIRSSIS